MILYLANMTQLDLSFAMNQCAQFSHDPKEPHAMALKQIRCYLKMTANNGRVLCKCTGIPKLNCWVDAEFAGLYSKKEPNDATSVCSCMAYASLGDNQ